MWDRSQPEHTEAGGVERPGSAVVAFAQLLAQRSDLQAAVKQASTPEAIVALAAQEGHPFTRLELRLASRELAARYWPWSEQGRRARLAFFGESWQGPDEVQAPQGVLTPLFHPRRNIKLG